MLFLQHNTDHYLDVIRDQYINQKPTIAFEQHNLAPRLIRKPHVKKVEIYYFNHRSTASLSIEGEYLCFVSHVVLQMKSTSIKYTFEVNLKESISSQSIQLLEKKIDLPTNFEKDCSQSRHGDYKEFSEDAVISLKSYFREGVEQEVAVIHKVLNHILYFHILIGALI